MASKTPITDTLASIREYLDRYTASGEPGAPPTRVGGLPGGMGLGTLLMGQAPEEYRRWGQGNSPLMTKPKEEGPPITRVMPGRGLPFSSDLIRFKPDRIAPTADAVMVGADAAGLANLATRGVRGGARAVAPVLNPEMDMSRREFMGNAGKVAAGAAAASVLPGALRGAEHVAEHAAPREVEHAVPTAVRAATVAEYRAALDAADKKILDELRPLNLDVDKFDRAFQRARSKAFAEIRQDPRFAEHVHLRTPREMADWWGEVHRKDANRRILSSPYPREWVRKQIEAGYMLPPNPVERGYLHHQFGIDDLPQEDIYLPDHFRKGGRVRMI